MAEATDSLSEDELGLIQGILEPLNKNPQNSEDLNPMAKVFRQKMGYAEPIQFSESDSEDEYEDEAEEIDNESSSEVPLDDFSENEPAPPSFKDFDDDDINLDDLLGESPAATPTNQETDELGLGDDFGDLPEDGESKEPTNDFGDLDDFTTTPTTPELGEEDPFSTTKEPEIGLGDDPFADLGGESPPDNVDFNQESSDDIFGGLEDLSSSTTTPALDDVDPFADSDVSSAGMDDFSGFDDFGTSDTAVSSKDTDDAFGEFTSATGEESDPFPDFGTSSGGDDFGFDDFGSSETASLPDTDDVFGDLGVDLASTPNLDDNDSVSTLEPTFDMMGDLEPPTLDDISPPDLHEIGGDGVLERLSNVRL
jgi:hypothetical protein